VVQYVVGDHLGSTSLVLNGDGTVDSEGRYYPYGVTRWSSGTLPTEYRFTGQREDGYIKLTVMGARWYDAQIGRWISPDPIIPDPANPQSFNRLSYVYNNPLRYTDLSGYDPLDAEWEQAFYDEHGYWPDDLDRFYRLYSIAYAGPVSGSWSWTEEDWIHLSGHHDQVLKSTRQRSSLADFSAAIGRISGWYHEGEEARFVSGLALLFAGWPYDPTGDNIIPVSFPSYKPIDFCQGAPGCRMRYYVNHGMEGFAGRYYRNAENTHHWAGHLITAYHMGRGKNLLLVRLREALQGDEDRNADIAMGDVAGMHAYALRRGYVSIAGFAPYVYQSLMVR
jgi:RHS repeat-associated protein